MRLHTSAAELVAAHKDQWAQAKAAAKGGPRVLIPTLVTGFSHVTVMESLLAVALTLRGAAVEFMVCDAALPGCMYAELDRVPDPAVFANYQLPQTICAGCVLKGRAAYEPLGLPIHKLGEGLDPAAARRVANTAPAETLRALVHEGVAVGEHAYAGALRYFGRGDLTGVDQADVVLRRYVEASILTVQSLNARLDAAAAEGGAEGAGFQTAVFHHGIYVPQGLVGEVMRARGLPLVNWNPSYRRNTFIFSHDDTYHHTLMEEPTALWETMDWSDAHEADIVAYLNSRLSGARDWIWFHERPDQDFEAFAQAVGLDRDKPIIGLLTNVIWDAQLHYPANAFPSMLEWMIETVRWFADRPDLQLLIRVHPAELRGANPSMQPAAAELAAAFPDWPANVFVIEPQSQMSTYAAMFACDSVLIYGTKTGVELTSMGVPVLVGGEAWIRGKGVTQDASSADQWRAMLEALPRGRRLEADVVARARRYAYHFFFRRMVPLPFVKSGKGIYGLELSSLDELAPGRHPGLDVLCRGVLEGAPFIYPAERLGLHDAIVA